MKFLALVGTEIKKKTLKQAAVRVSSQLIVSVLFIAVPTNTENFKFFLILVCVLFLASMQSYSYAHKIKYAVLICTGRLIAWL